MPDDTAPVLRPASNHRPWRESLRDAGLPAEATDVIRGVVRRTRLWRREKDAVAAELVAHFRDAQAAGVPMAAAVADFGDPARAAKLIRRAKVRQRAWTWHARRWVYRGLAVLVVAYAGVAVLYFTGRPRPSVDYIARLNRVPLAVADADRAWPLYVQARRELGVDDKTQDAARDAFRNAPDAVPPATAVSDWVAAHQAGIATLRRAAAKPAMGFIFGPDGSTPEAAPAARNDAASLGVLTDVMLPYLNYARFYAQNLVGDARVAAAAGDGGRVVADLTAALRLADQCRAAGPFVISGFVAVGINGAALDCVNTILRDRPAALDDAELVTLSHALAAPDVAGDLFDIDSDRTAMHDIIQHVYSDNGRGDGHLTASGVAVVRRLVGRTWYTSDDSQPRGWGEWLAEPAAVALASRKTITADLDRAFDLLHAQLRRPLRDGDDAAEQAFRAITDNPWRYGPVVRLLSSLNRVGWHAERYLGRRDGVVVAIALERYRRRHGEYPTSLDELTPALLPAVPADRITGAPVRYALIDGKPVVYSVGVDRTDDGGRVPGQPWLRRDAAPDEGLAAEWPAVTGSGPSALRGDWVVYATGPIRVMPVPSPGTPGG